MTGKKQFLLFSVLALGLMAGLSRVKQTQDNRGSAYFDKTTSSILPSTGSVKVGEKITASLWLNTTAKVDFVKSKWCASNNSLIPVEGSLSAVTPFATILFSNIEGSCISFAIKAEVPSTQLKTGVFQVATVKFEAKSVSTFVSVNISPVETEISGFNPSLDSTDMAISLENSEKGVYVVEAGPTATVTPPPGPNDTYLKFKVTMAGADDGVVSDSCSANLRAKVSVLDSAGEARFENVDLTKVGTKDVNGVNLVVWQGMVNLGNATVGDPKASMLIKGPKHVQMKYGVNNQSAYYNQALGSLNIVANTTNEFDFSSFPMLPGDVVSSSEGDNNPDGVVNGRDYAYLVSKLLSDDSKADLDYSCGVNARDLNLLKITLNERQSQKY